VHRLSFIEYVRNKRNCVHETRNGTVILAQTRQNKHVIADVIFDIRPLS
jgi:hypothetical protein